MFRKQSPDKTQAETPVSCPVFFMEVETMDLLTGNIRTLYFKFLSPPSAARSFPASTAWSTWQWSGSIRDRTRCRACRGCAGVEHHLFAGASDRHRPGAFCSVPAAEAVMRRAKTTSILPLPSSVPASLPCCHGLGFFFLSGRCCCFSARTRRFCRWRRRILRRSAACSRCSCWGSL